jgi:EAL domain-containing protein (putative c-di-GMP-specific phosphodiesterase class I)
MDYDFYPAEFVENKETVCKLQELGVDYAQGYHISKPHAVSDLQVNPSGLHMDNFKVVVMPNPNESEE